jgi:hypothetical protein
MPVCVNKVLSSELKCGAGWLLLCVAGIIERVSRKCFGSERNEVTGESRKLSNVELNL